MTTKHCPVKHDYERIPYLVAFQNNSGVRDVYGGLAEIVVLESYLLKPKAKPSDTVLVFMHPIGGGAYLPMINALARAGHHVIYCNSRFRGTDSALLMEKVDRGPRRLHQGRQESTGLPQGRAGRLERRRFAVGVLPAAGPACDRHVESVRRRARPDQTRPAAADGIMLLAAHISRHGTLTEWLDGSILDESDPTKRDPELDLYNPDNPNQPPYSEEFLDRYRQAQIDRNRRITAWVKDKLAELKAAGRPDDEFGFVVHGTMADPRWLDPAVDPNERAPGTCYLGDPQVVNMSPVGLARFSHAAQLAVAVELRRRARRRDRLRARHRGARAGDRQPRRRRLHPEPHPAAVRGDRPSGQGDARDPRRHPLLRRARPTRQAAPGRHIVTDWLHRHEFTGTAAVTSPARWTASGCSRWAP